MNYQRIYDQIIDRAREENRQKTKDGVYYEAHHIVPKCMGGEGKVSQWKTHSNIILLTAREHFLCHQLLCKIHPENRKLVFAFWAMCNQKSDGRDYVIDSRSYEEAKKLFVQTSSEYQKTFWQTEEGKAIIVERTAKVDFAKRAANTDYVALHKKRVANTDYRSFQAKRIANTDYTKRINNLEYSAKRYKAIEQYNRQGILIREWQSVKAASESLGIAKTNISSCLTGRLRSAGGFFWKYKN